MINGQATEKSELSQPAAVLSPVLKVSVTLFQVETNRRVGGTGSAVMNRFGVGEKNNSLSRLVKPVAPIDILSVHEELRVERSDPIQGASANQDEPAVQYLDRRSRLVIKIRHQVSAKQLGVLEGHIEPQGTAELVPDGRETHRGTPNFAIPPQHFRPRHADPWILRKIAQHGRQAVAGKLDVGIHEADILARALRDADVIGLGES